MTPLPFRTVTARGDDLDHLVVLSPALRSSNPDRLPVATLCGAAVEEESPNHIADIGCLRCLDRCPAFLGLPAFQARP